MTIPYTFAWRTSFKLARWFPMLGSAILFAFWMITPDWQRAVELSIPLMAGLHAAFIFAPEDEPALELVCAAPRPLRWLLIERLAWVLLLHGAVGLVATFITAGNAAINPLHLLIRWLPPFLFTVGFGVYAALTARRSNISALMVIGITLALMLGGDGFAMRFPVSYPLNPYPLFIPDMTLFALNRVVVTLIGAGLLARALLITSHNERMVGID